jgi:hypothetical protein
VRASVGPAGEQFLGASALGDMTPDGRYVVVLRTMASWRLVYRFDRLSGTSVPVSVGLIDETPSISAQDALITDDGNIVIFQAFASEPLVEGDLPLGAQLYQRDIAAGVTTGVSVNELGEWASASIEGFGISVDARYIGLLTKATNLAIDTPQDVARSWLFRLDQTTQTTQFLSRGELGLFDQGIIPPLALSDDGQRIGFVTRATNVLALNGVVDTATFNDVFILTVGEPIEGDLDGDGLVGATDLAILLGAWGLPGAADLDGSGAVGAEDLAILLGAWNG